MPCLPLCHDWIVTEYIGTCSERMHAFSVMSCLVTSALHPHTRAHTHLAMICMLLTALTHSVTEGMRSYPDTPNTQLLSVFSNWQKDISFTNENRNSWVTNLSISLFVGVHKHTRAQNLDLFLWTSWESRNEALKMALIPSVCLVFCKEEMRRWHLI